MQQYGVCLFVLLNEIFSTPRHSQPNTEKQKKVLVQVFCESLDNEYVIVFKPEMETICMVN